MVLLSPRERIEVMEKGKNIGRHEAVLGQPNLVSLPLPSR